MKVRLIKPSSIQRYHPTREYALGLLYLGAILEEDGHDVMAYDWVNDDLDSDLSRVTKLMQKQRPDVIGINCDSHNRYSCFRIAARVKKINPKTLVIIGGVHASYFYEDILKKIRAVDYVVLGEGEYTMSELLKCVENDGDLDAIDGLAYRKGTDVVKTKLRKRIEKLDILPIPKHEYYSRYIRKYRKAHIVSSRGCPAKCKFCSPMGYWGGFRARSAQSIFEEIQYLVKRFGRLDFFHFQDQCFTYDRQRVVDLCNILAVNDVKINWGFETRVDCVDPELLQLLKGAGCSYIAYGIESGSDRILNTLNKNFTSAQAADALKWTHDAGIRTCVYLIVGSPGETKKTIAETKQFLRRHAKYIPEIQIGRYFIYPWSPLYRKLFKDDKDFWYKNKKIPVNLNRGSFLGLILDQVEIRLSYILSKGPRFALNRLLLIFKRKKLSFF